MILSAIKTLQETLKNGIEFAKNSNNVEMQQKLVDVQIQMLEIHEKMLEMYQENETLKAEIKQLKDDSELDKKVENHNSPFITFSDDEQKIKYCQICWGNNRKRIQLVISKADYGHSSVARCVDSNCKNYFYMR